MLGSSSKGELTGEAMANLQTALARASPLLDMRTAAAFTTRHLRSSTSMPLSEFAHRTGELPPPPCDVIVLAEPGELEASLARLEGSKWRVVAALASTDALWEAAEELGATAVGTESRRLWEPSPHLPRVVDEIERLCGVPHSDPQHRLRALDLGCGRGRDAVYLAARGCWEVRL